MATLPEIVNRLEGDDSLHLGRLLLLIDAFAGRKGEHPIEGLTKLAKLDFLLRYPAYLERALVVRKAPEAAAQVQEFERNSVEAHMVRFRFGPWDYQRARRPGVGRCDDRRTNNRHRPDRPRPPRRHQTGAAARIRLNASTRRASEAPSRPESDNAHGVHL